MKRILSALAAVFFLLPAPAQQVPEWLKEGILYHIYPSSFKDSDGDGIGDLEGIRSKLPYIKSLGANTVWLSPVFQSEFEDGGYDITDFYRIDPRFGTNSQLVRLVREAHATGIRVCLDSVAGHTSDKHPWFRQSSEADRKLQYSGYCIGSDSKDSFPTKKFVRSDAAREGNYMKDFLDIQPALNYGYLHPDPAQPWQQGYDDPGPTAVGNEPKNIISFRMDKDVDGFRCDMAQSLVKGDDKQHTGTMRLWHELRNWFEAKYPEDIPISELKTALTFFLTLPAVPILYYGEEIGMRNQEDAPVKKGNYASRNRSSCRTPIDPSPARPTVAGEERDPQSILNYVKGLIALRRQTPALGTRGAWRFVSDVEQPYPMIYARELDGQKYLVALNPSKRSVTARFASEGASAETVYATDEGAKYGSKKRISTLKMRPVSAVILKITE